MSCTDIAALTNINVMQGLKVAWEYIRGNSDQDTAHACSISFQNVHATVCFADAQQWPSNEARQTQQQQQQPHEYQDQMHKAFGTHYNHDSHIISGLTIGKIIILSSVQHHAFLFAWFRMSYSPLPVFVPHLICDRCIDINLRRMVATH